MCFLLIEFILCTSTYYYLCSNEISKCIGRLHLLIFMFSMNFRWYFSLTIGNIVQYVFISFLYFILALNTSELLWSLCDSIAKIFVHNMAHKNKYYWNHQRYQIKKIGLKKKNKIYQNQIPFKNHVTIQIVQKIIHKNHSIIMINLS